MTKRRSRLSAVLLAAVTLAGASCARDSGGGTEAGGGGGDGSTPTGAFIDPASDCTSYQGTAGIDGDTIKIGTIRPATGNYAIYDQVTAGLEAWVTSTNNAGGIKAGDGKTYKIELHKEDDGYDPARTPGVTKKLVEEDGVFGLVGVIGTEDNLAVRDYLNDKCVPNIALATGSVEWGKANRYPWYISALPSYATEAHGWVQLLQQEKPDAKIALLYQSDDFGQAYQATLKKEIEGTGMQIVAEQSFDPKSGATPESAVVQLSQSGADVFILGIGGSPCPTALTFVPQTWKPMTIMSVTCALPTALALARGADEGVYAIQPTYDPSDPADKNVPAVKEFAEKASAAGLSQQQIEGGIPAVGWGFGAMFGLALEKSPTVDRATVMNTLYSLKDTSFGLLRDGVTVNTNGADDPWAIEGFRIVQRKDGGWVEVMPIENFEGQSNGFAG